MKRSIFFLGFILLASLVFAMDDPNASPSGPKFARVPDDQLFVRKIIQVSKSKDELFSKSMEWMAKTCYSSTDVIRFTDKDAGIIVGKAWMFVPGKIFSSANYFTLTIEVKDNKIRATIDDPHTEVVVDGNITSTVINRVDTFTDRFKPAAEDLLASLEKFVSAKPEQW